MLPSMLISAHVNCNLGIYFDGVEEVMPSLRYAYSARIRDGYWNYGYRVDGAELSEHERDAVVRIALLHDRKPVILQVAASTTPPGWQQISEEIWMTKTLEVSDAYLSPESMHHVHELPTEQMIAVFGNAYGTQENNDAIGYVSLPREYSDAYRQGTARDPARSLVVEVCDATYGTAAVASICIVDKLAGLYSVGTSYACRRRGFGRQVSKVALAVAANEGAGAVFLQTEANSPVEEMYRSIGFARSFLAGLYSVAEDS